MSAFKKALIVVIGAIGVSALTIQASDTLRGLETSLSALVFETKTVCGEGAVELLLGSHALCVDVYEAAPAATCPHQRPTNQSETQANMNAAECRADSRAAVEPWRFVSLTQAQQLCARGGKRLPTNDEWYTFSSGIADQSMCVTSNPNNPKNTGSAGCVTPAGVHDVIGNVWEWIDGEVVNGMYNSRQLPQSGYVALVDSDGVVVETSNTPQAEYDEDYAWTKNDGVYGVIRGGFYGSEEDAGIFAQNLAVPLDFRTAGVGFRCVRDI